MTKNDRSSLFRASPRHARHGENAPGQVRRKMTGQGYGEYLGQGIKVKDQIIL